MRRNLSQDQRQPPESAKQKTALGEYPESNPAGIIAGTQHRQQTNRTTAEYRQEADRTRNVRRYQKRNDRKQPGQDQMNPGRIKTVGILHCILSALQGIMLYYCALPYFGNPPPVFRAGDYFHSV